MLLSSPFYKWGYWGTERSHLLRSRGWEVEELPFQSPNSGSKTVAKSFPFVGIARLTDLHPCSEQSHQQEDERTMSQWPWVSGRKRSSFHFVSLGFSHSLNSGWPQPEAEFSDVRACSWKPVPKDHFENKKGLHPKISSLSSSVIDHSPTFCST